MATSRDLCSHVTDIIKCPICLELFNSPKSLPCLHTFCLKCIEGHCVENEPGDEVACPMCRQKFSVPESGAKGLVNNFFIAGLVEARKIASDVAIQVPCEVCLQEFGNEDAVSTMYCIDCKQKLCERCSIPHKRIKVGPHKVVSLDSEVETYLIQAQVGKCDKHEDECVKLFCFDCKINICFMCFAEEHKSHDCKNLKTVASERVKKLEENLEAAKENARGARTELSRLDDERTKFLSGVEDAGNKLVETGEVLKKLIDEQVNELMLEVQSLKNGTCQKIESLRDNVKMKLLAFETFSTYCSELKLKGKPYDITRAANDVDIRANELLQNDIKQKDYRAPSMTFSPMNVDELLDVGQNFIGKVKLTNSDETPSSISFVTENEKKCREKLKNAQGNLQRQTCSAM